MRALFCQLLSPACRTMRLALAEKRLETEIIIERFWEERAEFLDISPAAQVPALIDGAAALTGVFAIPEYLEETYPAVPLWPKNAADRREARRLYDWFMTIFQEQVTDTLLMEKVNPRFCGARRVMKRSGPDIAAIRDGLDALGRHLDLIGIIADARRWLAGDELTYADLAAAAQLSCLDYAGDIEWRGHEEAKVWYQRVKSRPAFRPFLSEAVPGVQPSRRYAELDF